MDAELRSLGNFPSNKASNYWVWLAQPGELECRSFTTSRILEIPQVGEVITITIRTWEGALSTIIELRILPGCFRQPPSGLLDSDSCKPMRCPTLCTRQLPSSQASRASLEPLQSTQFFWSILRIIIRTMTDVVKLLNNFCSNFTALA